MGGDLSAHLLWASVSIQALGYYEVTNASHRVARKRVPSTRQKYASRLVHKFSPTKRQVHNERAILNVREPSVSPLREQMRGNT